MIEVTILFKSLQASGYLFSKYMCLCFFFVVFFFCFFFVLLFFCLGGCCSGLVVVFYVCFLGGWDCLILKEAILHV